MQNFLLVGGNGFIGSHLVDRLTAQNHSICVIDKFYEKFREPLSGVEYVVSESVGDEIINSKIEWADCIIYLASNISPSSNVETIPSLEYELNPLIKVIDFIKGKGKKFVYLSSGGAVYGLSDKKIPIKEDKVCKPKSLYGIIKLTAELLIEHTLKNSNTKYTIIRPSNPYGPRQDPYGKQGVISIFLKKIINNESIEIYGNANNIVKDYIYITDLVDGIYKACINNKLGVCLNIGYGSGTKLSQIISLIKKISNKNIIISEYEKKSFDVEYLVLDNKLAREELVWIPNVDLDRGINLTYEYLLGQFRSGQLK